MENLGGFFPENVDNVLIISSELMFSIPERGSTMTYSSRNSGKAWTKAEIKQVEKMAKENTPTRVMGFKLGRTAVRKAASENDISLKPTNQSPYNRKP